MAGSPASWILINAPAGVFSPFSMNLLAGFSENVQISRNTFLASRFFTEILTGWSGAGNRSDSEKVRFISCASPVVSHSPKIDAKPRE